VNDAEADVALMLRYQNGDAAAFDQLYARHRGGLYRYLLRQVATREIAEELFQDIWMKLIGARLSYKPSAQFNTWLYTLAHHRLVDHYRQHARSSAVEFDAPDLSELTTPASRLDEPEVQSQAREQRSALLSAVGALPAPQREAFLLSVEGELSVEGIAAATGIGFESAKSRLRYALSKLRAALREFA